jgi:hypothetical protein
MNDNEQFIKNVAQGLVERFDAVQILVTWEEEGETQYHYVGFGNLFARIGMARDFVDATEQEEFSGKLAKAIGDRDEGEDEAF